MAITRCALLWLALLEWRQPSAKEFSVPEPIGQACGDKGVYGLRCSPPAQGQLYATQDHTIHAGKRGSVHDVPGGVTRSVLLF